MKSFLQASLLMALLMLPVGCVEEGQSPECGAGGRANWEEKGCVTPKGGSCLTEEEFKHDRPDERSDPDDPDGDPITIEEDWDAYQEERPNCDFSASE